MTLRRLTGLLAAMALATAGAACSSQGGDADTAPSTSRQPSGATTAQASTPTTDGAPSASPSAPPASPSAAQESSEPTALPTPGPFPWDAMPPVIGEWDLSSNGVPAYRRDASMIMLTHVPATGADMKAAMTDLREFSGGYCGDYSGSLRCHVKPGKRPDYEIGLMEANATMDDMLEVARGIAGYN